MDHSEKQHPNIEISYELEFDWVVLVPGPGHLEINMLRSLVGVCLVGVILGILSTVTKLQIRKFPEGSQEGKRPS